MEKRKKMKYKLSYKERDDLIFNYRDGDILQNLFDLLSKEHNILPLETELFEIIHIVLENIDLNKWKDENKSTNNKS